MKATYASGLGPWKGNLLPRETAMAARMPMVTARRSEPGQAGPARCWRMRSKPACTCTRTRCARRKTASRNRQRHHPSVVAEAMQLYGLGVQGLFIDQPDLGVAARGLFLGRNRP